MGEKAEYKVIITYMDGNLETWENVKSMTEDEGMVCILYNDLEIDGNRILHQQDSIPIHRIRKMTRTYVCTMAEHKANEARYSDFQALAGRGFQLLSGYAQTDDDGGDEPA